MLAHVGHRMENEKHATNSHQELDDYPKAPLQSEGTDAIKWWGKHTSQYPVLARMARDYLSIPTSSKSDSERVFSVTAEENYYEFHKNIVVNG